MSPNPTIALTVGVVIISLLILLVAPRGGVLGWWRRSRESTMRVRMEDALKHMYDCEERGITSSLKSVAGALAISQDRAARLVQRLEILGLVQSRASALELTAEGRSNALRVIRVHRLWEFYLADETALHETEWHKEAERQEHLLTQSEVEALAARMGNPGFDPHGDPIPSARGEVPRRTGFPLTGLAEGAVARIVHLEDEPPSVYAQLVTMGLYPGMQIRMIGNSPEEVRVAANGEERVLAPLMAQNVTVADLPVDQRKRVPSRTLDTLRPGEHAVVVSLSRVIRGQQRRRLMDLGVVPGTEVTPELASLGGDPTAYRVRGSLVALRRKHAEQIFVEIPGEEL